MSQYIFAALTIQIAVTKGQSLSELPTCAQGCISGENAFPASCAGTDIACICQNGQFINDQGCCIYNTCPESDISAATDFASRLCAGVQVDIPTTSPTNCSEEELTSTNDGPIPTNDTSSSSIQPTESPGGPSTPTPNIAAGAEHLKGSGKWNVVAVWGALMAII